LGVTALPLLPACSAPLPKVAAGESSAAAQALLSEAADAHGAAAVALISDLSVSYAGRWRSLVARLQPELVDAGFRGTSEERYLLREGVTGQTHLGASGAKHVVRREAPHAPGDVQVWFNGKEADDTPRRAAAALVVDGYTLFLLGPTALQTLWAKKRTMAMAMGGVERVEVGGRLHTCDVVGVDLAPGLGLSGRDRLALFIDREQRLMRKVRFTLNGLESTRGAVAEVDAFDHVTIGGVQWPTGFHEQLLRPLPLPVHDWRLTGLDIDRGLQLSEVNGTMFSGRALSPAAVLRGG